MALMQETDFGTPLRISNALVTLEIDGKPVTVPQGTSVMRAAVEAGIQVPKLCATDSVESFGCADCASLKSTANAGRPRRAPLLANPG